MASFKVSEFTGVSATTDDSLLMLSFTEDNGASYSTRKIRIEDLFSNIAQDSDVSSLITLTGMPSGSVNLGSFTGSTISDNLTIKQALQQIESAVEGKQTSLTAGDGIAIDTGEISVSLAPDSFLEFDGGSLKASVLDEDDFSSDSDSHVPTQQSVKAYVDAANTSQDTAIDAAYVRQDGTKAFSGDQSMGGFRLTNLGAPTAGADAVSKQYVDSATSGQGAFWTTVRVASESNITLSGLQTIDGVTLLSGDRVLVTGQTDATENGIYAAAAGAWTRSSDADEASEFIVNKTVYTSEGTTNAGNVYAYGGPEDPTLGTSELSFLLKQESAGIQDGSITTAKLADLAVTDAKIANVAASKITGTLQDSTVTESNVTQHEGALELGASQITSGTFADSLISESSVTQHQAALSITESQISDLQAYALQADLDETNLDVAALTTLSGVAARSTSLGTFTGTTIQTNNTVKGALQDLESALEAITIDDLGDGSDVVLAGDNINRLVGSTGADGEPAAYLFVVVDQADGSIKVIDKTFIEIE